jgi:hypothetical protein
MLRVRLIHWNADEARERARRIRSDRYEVDAGPINPAVLREMRQNPPHAFIIDLSRLPSQGRDLALNIRKYKSTRYVPLIFVEGDAQKVGRIKEVLPDAVYTSWDRIHNSLEQAIAQPPQDPVTPQSVFDVYAGTPLIRKLGIKAQSAVALVDAPQDFEATLGQLPEGVVLCRGARGRCDVTLWFVRSLQDLNRRIERMARFIAQGRLWILWPKKASGISTDISQVVVREVGLEAGLVDFKICSVDKTWSGLCFTRRK